MNPVSFTLIAVLVLGSLALILQSPPSAYSDVPRLRPFEHAGHQYLERVGNHSTSPTPFIHDPDCPCNLNPEP